MSSNSLPNNSSLPGEHFEVRQTSSSDDYHPDPSKSIPLSPARQALMDDIIALYSYQPRRSTGQVSRTSSSRTTCIRSW